MESIPWRVQLAVVAGGYVAVILVAAVLLYSRRMQYVNHPADAVAAGGMYACGDLILELFIAGLFLIMTFVLVLVIRKSETAYTRYSQILLGLSFTAPICSMALIPAVGPSNVLLGEILISRLWISPLVIVGMVFSRLFARFDRAKRLTSYALSIETATLVLLVALFLFATSSPR